VKKLRKLPPNFANLSDEEKVIIEEQMYRLQIIAKDGYPAHSELLTSREKIKEEYGD